MQLYTEASCLSITPTLILATAHKQFLIILSVSSPFSLFRRIVTTQMWTTPAYSSQVYLRTYSIFGGAGSGGTATATISRICCLKRKTVVQVCKYFKKIPRLRVFFNFCDFATFLIFFYVKPFSLCTEVQCCETIKRAHTEVCPLMHACIWE